MTEARIPVERFYSTLSDVREKMTRAIAVTGLKSTQGLCHQINYSIALKLSREFGIPIMEYNLSTHKKFSNDTPAIAYVSKGALKSPTEKNPHSYPIIFGIESSPVLIDGANDQIDPANPFLVQKLGKTDFNAVSSNLRRSGHFIRQPDLDTRTKEAAMKGTLENVLKAGFRVKEFTEDDVAKIMEQFTPEYEAGLGHLIYENRDLLAYFMKSLGIAYPPIQRQAAILFRILKEMGAQLPVYNEGKQFDTLAERLKSEGLI